MDNNRPTYPAPPAPIGPAPAPRPSIPLAPGVTMPDVIAAEMRMLAAHYAEQAERVRAMRLALADEKSMLLRVRARLCETVITDSTLGYGTSAT